MDEYAERRYVEERLGELSRRIDDLAKDMVTTVVWQQDKDHVRELLAISEAQSKERHKQVMTAITDVRQGIVKKSEWTWTRTIGVLGVAVAIIAICVSVIVTSGGPK